MRRGFTLVESLVVVGILLVLAAVGAGVYGSVSEKAMLAREVSAAKELVAGVGGYAADHGGRLPAGYREDEEAHNDRDEVLYAPVNARYPWRLYPYVPSLEALVFNGNERHLEEENRDYLVSVSPNLGMNAVFVGGHWGSSSALKPTQRILDAVGTFYVANVSDAEDPANLVVFASARSPEGVGYFEIQPPKVLGALWGQADFDPDLPASSHGFVDFRWNRKAVTATLDGSVHLWNEETLRDMRKWANDAVRFNDPDYTVKPQ